MDEREPEARRGRYDHARRGQNRDIIINNPPKLSDAEVDALLERLTGRWFIACVKVWGGWLGSLVIGTAVLWLPPLIRSFARWLSQNAP